MILVCLLVDLIPSSTCLFSKNYFLMYPGYHYHYHYHYHLHLPSLAHHFIHSFNGTMNWYCLKFIVRFIKIILFSFLQSLEFNLWFNACVCVCVSLEFRQPNFFSMSHVHLHCWILFKNETITIAPDLALF